MRIIDCHHFGLSRAEEPLAKIRDAADEWKQPFQKEYTERSVNQTFEKLLGLRTDVERALEKIAPKASQSAAVSEKTANARSAEPQANLEVMWQRLRQARSSLRNLPTK